MDSVFIIVAFIFLGVGGVSVITTILSKNVVRQIKFSIITYTTVAIANFLCVINAFLVNGSMIIGCLNILVGIWMSYCLVQSIKRLKNLRVIEIK